MKGICAGLIVAIGLIAMGCGGTTRDARKVVPTSSTAPRETVAALRVRLGRMWMAKDAIQIPGDAGAAAKSPRMRVAHRLLQLGPDKPVVNRQTAEAVLGTPEQKADSGATWIYLVSRREPNDAPGDVCTRHLAITFDQSGRAGAFVSDDEEDCASDSRPAKSRS
ncbi:MAG: hypothetical protein JWQ18_3579 [Conexibacter sp.]|nr:hypothetical protein [Conexibacter sp.]